MIHRFKARSMCLVLCFVLLAGCRQSPSTITLTGNASSTPALALVSQAAIATQPQPSATPTPTLTPLAVSLLYPGSQVQAQMGQTIKLIVQVEGVPDAGTAQVTATFQDAAGDALGTIPLTAGKDGIFRSDSWTIPHHSQAGDWKLSVEAHTSSAQGVASGTFQVQPSTSEALMAKYGFWLDAPTLRDIVPSVSAEEGDAQNGLVRWGGIIPSQHVFPENWVDIQWRTGDFHLDNAAAVQQFMDSQIGDQAAYYARSIGPFERVKFKNWDAWKVGARGEFQHTLQEWMIFYAPEVNKTYSLGTIAILPPSGIDPHAVLRSSFEVYPELHANGVAPEPLPQLLPTPHLITPTLGAHFVGIQRPIVLKWQPLKELAQDEYYRVDIQFNYDESSPLYRYATRQTQFNLPDKLYSQPNCRIFNWQVTLMRKTGEDQNGQPVGDPLSYPSLYWYFEWFYPTGQAEPFTVLCPNPQT
jgi:hypothetical protein